MRQIVLDTETTGLDPNQGHRIIEIGCVELVNRRITSKRYHQYIHPERDIDEGAQEVHGISLEFLDDKPRFAEVAQSFLNFVRGAELVIHNAPFDVGFLNAEFKKLDTTFGQIEQHCTVLDTLVLARSMHPGQKNNLDALCKRYEIDNSRRDLHGALLDAEILADVYLAMTGGQTTLSLGADEEGDGSSISQSSVKRVDTKRPPLRVIMANTGELAQHQKRLDALDKAYGQQCLWRQMETQHVESPIE